MTRQAYLEQALNSLNQALVVIDHRKKVVYTSPYALDIVGLGDGLAIVDNALQASLEHDEQQLTLQLAYLLDKDRPRTPQEINIERPSGKLPYKLRIIPIHPDTANGTPSRSGALVIIQDAHANQQAWHERLMERYNLTPRECECAILLTNGFSMAEAAERMAISMQTLRQHLKHAFNKTGTHKQHELVSLLLPMLRKR